MVDYKFGMGVDENDLKETRDAVRKLLDSLRKHTTFIPLGKDKTVANIDLTHCDIGTTLPLTLRFGKPDDAYLKPFELPLPPQFRGKKVRDLHDALQQMSRMDPGGNVPNMIRNLAHIMGSPSAPRGMTIDLYSTDEPLFQVWFSSLSQQTRDRIRLTLIDVPARKGLHLPYSSDDPSKHGTLGIGTPLHSTIHSMEEHFPRLITCNHVLVSESLHSLVKKKADKEQYHEFQDPSTAFREQCAIESYNHMLNGGMHMPVVTMNDEEMIEYLTSLEKRRDAPLSVNQPLTFAAPFDGQRQLNDVTMQQVSNTFERYFACVTPRPHTTLHFPLNVSCGSRGGYHIACTPKGTRFAIFSSTPRSTEGAQRMLSTIGKNDDISLEKSYVMGAGDAVATVLSLAHLWDIPEMLRTHANKTHPLDARFIETASIIFVSLLSRFVGEMVFHSDRCDWTSVPQELFPDIVRRVAEKSLDAATHVWGRTEKPQQVRENEWDMDIAIWELQ